MPDWLSAPPAAGTSVRTRGITGRAGKNNAKEYFYENEENGSGFYRMRRKTPPFRAGDIRRVRRICVSN